MGSRNWSELHEPLLMTIANFTSIKDFIAFAGVCKSWRSAAMETSPSRLKHQVPLLMCCEQRIGSTSNTFFSLGGSTSNTTRKVYNLEENKLLTYNNPPQVKQKICFSSLGWLMVVDSYSSEVTLVRILAPNQVIRLPNVENLRVQKFALSSSPCKTSNYIVMILCEIRSISGWWRKLVFCRPEVDNVWTVIETKNFDPHFEDIICYNGKFYAVDQYIRIFVCDIDVENTKQAQLRVVVPAMTMDARIAITGKRVLNLLYLYLVESSGSLLLVLHWAPMKSDAPECLIRVLEVNGNGIAWSSNSEIRNLGKRALFLCGYSSSFSVEPLTLQNNCIYLVKDGCLLTYNMEDGILEKWPSFDDNLLPPPKPRIWIQPSLQKLGCGPFSSNSFSFSFKRIFANPVFSWGAM